MDMKQVETLIKEAELLKGKMAYVKGVSNGTMKELHRASAMLEVGIQMLKDDRDEVVQNLALLISMDVMNEYKVSKEMCLAMLKYAGGELVKYENMADNPETPKDIVDIIDDYIIAIQMDVSAIVASVTKCSRLECPDGFTVPFEFYAPLVSAMDTIGKIEGAISGKDMVTA